MGAGQLDRRFRFEKREAKRDGHGNVSGDWFAQFTVWGRRKYMRGGETLQGGRLEGRSPAILAVRQSRQTADIRADWRAVDTRSLEVFNIRENPQLSDDRAFYEMLVETGVTT